MKQAINNKLAAIAAQHDITILYACESGSRAWGFPSPDSDYDIRFFYVHRLDWYLSVSAQADVIDLPIDADLLDMNGWELRKTCALLKKSNAAPFEWLQSPIIYTEVPGFRDAFWAVARRSAFHHYQNLARKCYDQLTEPSISLKKLFYGLRSALAAHHVVHQPGVPPLTLANLLQPLAAQHAQVAASVQELVALKATKDESFTLPAQPLLLNFIDALLGHGGEAAIRKLPTGQGDAAALNAFLANTVKQHTHP